MKIIFNNHSQDIGGIETFLLDLANLLSLDNEIFFIVNNEWSYYQSNIKSERVKFLYKKSIIPVEFATKRKLEKERHHILSQFEQNFDYYVISFRFSDFQYALSVFGEKKNFKLIHFWNHPMAWIDHLYLFGNNRYMSEKKSINKRKYLYQRELLIYLESRLADYIGFNYKGLQFNNWFYDVNIGLNPNSFPFPVLSKCSNKVKSNNRNFNESKLIKVLWVGRYDWFKLGAIQYIINTLESLNDDVNISFDIVGYGNKEQDLFINKLKENSSINVNILGKINYSDLSNLFDKYHLGIGMGLTVKNMADCALPSILIDSIDDINIEKKSCIWFFDSEIDDSGDGYYYEVSGGANMKETLRAILIPILDGKTLLSEVSMKSKEFFDQNYSMQKNIPNFKKLLMSSQFNGTNYGIFRRPFFLRVVYSIYQFIPEKFRIIMRRVPKPNI